MATRKPPSEQRLVSELKLTPANRRKIAKDLQVDKIEKIPDRILIARVPHAELGLTAAQAARQSWILVDA